MGTGSTRHSPSCRCAQDRSVEEQESSECGRLPRRGTSWWPCSSESTCHEGSLQAGRKEGIVKEMIDSKESSRSRRGCRRSRTQFSDEDRGWSQRACRQLETTHGEQYHIWCARNPAEARTSGGCSAAVSCQCRFRHHEGSRPKILALRQNVRMVH